MKRAYDLCVGLSLATAACGPSLDPEVVVHPPRPTTMRASGEAERADACATRGHTEPLVVDWLETRRSDLALVMKEGTAVVSYDCTTLQLLNQCRLPGTYSFAAVTRQEQVVRLTNPLELQANVPFGAGALRGALEGGGSVDVALVVTGKNATTVTTAAPQELTGSCTGATHFVRSVYLGAFAMDAGSPKATPTVDQLFAATSSAAHGQGGVPSRAGELDACRGAKPDAQAPAERCQVPVRVELVPLAARPPAHGEATAAEAEEKDLKLSSPCPPGTILSGGKCASPAHAASHLCDPEDERACTSQCDRGDAGSCYHLAYHYLGGKDLPRDDARAAALFEKACAGGVARACHMLASQQLSSISSNRAAANEAERAKVRANSDKACEMGDGWACWTAAEWYLREGTLAVLPRDPARAAALLRRGCALGHGPSCSTLGNMQLEGKIAAKDVTSAVGLLQRACDGGRTEDCLTLGNLLRSGQGTPKDGARAVAVYAHACLLGDMRACNAAGTVYAAGDGVPKDVAKAYGYFEKGCPEKGFGAEACLSLASMYEQGSGIPKDMARAAALYERVCGSGGCVRAAEIWQRGDGVTADADKALSLYEQACSKWGEKKACDALGPLLEGKDKARAREFYQDHCARTRDKVACASAKRLGGTVK